MSETVKTLMESLFMISAISAAIAGYAVVVGRREDRDTQQSPAAASAQRRAASTFNAPIIGKRDQDAHLGRCGAE